MDPTIPKGESMFSDNNEKEGVVKCRQGPEKKQKIFRWFGKVEFSRYYMKFNPRATYQSPANNSNCPKDDKNALILLIIE